MSEDKFTTQRRQALALVAILAVATLLRLVNLGEASLWYDEIRTAEAVTSAGSFSELLSDVERYVDRAPLHEILLAGWVRLGAGTSEFALRLPSLLAGVASILGIYFLGRRIFNGRIGLLAALLLALSQFHVEYSQEARRYVLFTLLSLCTLIAFLRYIDRRTFSRWLALAVLHTLCLYSEYSTILLMACEGIYATYLLLKERISRPAAPVMSWTAYIGVAGAMALAVGLLLPWFFYAVVEVRTRELYTALDWGWLLSVLGPLSADRPLSVLVFMAAFAAGVVHCIRSRRREGLLLTLITVLPPFAVLAFVNRAGTFFAPRYVLFILPSFLLLVAAGIAALAGLVDVVVMRLTWRRLVGVCFWATALAVFVSLDAVNVWRYCRNHRYHEDWKRAAQYLDANVGPDDLVVSMAVFQGAFCLKYYARPELHERVLDVRDLAELPRRPYNNAPDANFIPSTVWFVSPKHCPADPEQFESASFPRMHIVYRTRSIERWDDFWQLVTYYVKRASTTTKRYKGPMLKELSQMLSARGENALAYEIWKDGAPTSPNKPSYQRLLGQLAFKTGDLEAAADAFRATLALDPKSYALAELTRVLLWTGKNDEALEVVLDAVAAKDGLFCRAWLGTVYLARQEYDLAEEEYLKALAMDPNHAWTHYHLGRVYALTGRVKEAAAEFNEALRLDPDGPVSGRIRAEARKLRQLEASGR